MLRRFRSSWVWSLVACANAISPPGMTSRNPENGVAIELVVGPSERPIADGGWDRSRSSAVGRFRVTRISDCTEQVQAALESWIRDSQARVLLLRVAGNGLLAHVRGNQAGHLEVLYRVSDDLSSARVSLWFIDADGRELDPFGRVDDIEALATSLRAGMVCSRGERTR